MTETQADKLPTVSVIVPVYNDRDNIARLLDSLLRQDYPAELTEIIVVDNNSADDTRDVVRRYPVTLLRETQTQSSYAARNRGINVAKNQILAFIDSDCTAEPDWLKVGVRCLREKQADLIGGKVEFSLPHNASTAEIFDSIMHFRFQSTIAKSRATGAGNLFVRRHVFEKTGLFPENVISGGDFIWTAKAAKTGFTLVYSPEAVVRHPARGLKAMLKQRHRIGRGAVHVWLGRGRPLWRIMLYSALSIFFPAPPTDVVRAVCRRKNPDLDRRLPVLWFIACLCKISGRAGVLAETLKMSLTKPRNGQG